MTQSPGDNMASFRSSFAKGSFYKRTYFAGFGIVLLYGCQTTENTKRTPPALSDRNCNSTGCLGSPNYQPNPNYYPNGNPNNTWGDNNQKGPAQSQGNGPYGNQIQGQLGPGTYPGFVPYYGADQIVGSFWIPGLGIPGFWDNQNQVPGSSSNFGAGKQSTPSPVNTSVPPPIKGAPPTQPPPTNPVPNPTPPPPAYGACAPEVLARNQTVTIGGSQFSRTATASYMTGIATVISKFTSKYVVLSNGAGFSVNSITSPVIRNGRLTSDVTPVNYDSNQVAYMTVEGMNIPFGVVYKTSDGKSRMDLINGTCVVQYGASNGGIPWLVVP
jgi:hypothetical protein